MDTGDEGSRKTVVALPMSHTGQLLNNSDRLVIRFHDHTSLF